MSRPAGSVGALTSGVLAFVFGAVALVSLASFAGRWVWQLDLLTHFRMQYVAFLALGSAVLVFTERRAATAFVVLGLAVNSILVVPLFLPGGGEDGSHGTPLRLLSFNVKGFATDPEPVLEFLRDTDADVVFLHEANVDWEDYLAEGEVPFELSFPRREGSIFGTAVLTRQADEVRGLVLGPDQRVAVEVTLTHEGTPVQILGIHAYAPVSKYYSDIRDRQFGDVERWATAAEGPAIVIGDFNATRWSHAFPSSGVVDTAESRGFQASWPAGLEPFAIPIDHAVVTEEWVTVRRWLGPDLGSDHYPLFLDVALLDG